MNNRVETPDRLYYLDWIRVLAMVCIFFFHNARFYDVFGDWHVRNATTDPVASGIVAFMSLWIMPLFFLIAGAGTYFALKAKRAGQFIQERSLRLLVPLIFGMFVIVVPQAYFEALFDGAQLSQYNFFQIYGLYLTTLPDLQWFHLWFLVYLFIFSIGTVPIFIPWKRGAPSIISRIAAVFNKPWAMLLLLVLPLAVAQILLFPAGFWGHRGSGGWNFVTYILFFISGYLLFANERIMEKFNKMGWGILAAAVISSICLVVFFLDTLTNVATAYGTPNYMLASFLQALSVWCWMLSFLSLGKRFMNKNSGFLSYANEAVLPFYILHQTVIISIGYFIVQWDTSVGLKYLTIFSASFVAIMAIYELLVRRINVIRFLFGMRPKIKPHAALAIENKG